MISDSLDFQCSYNGETVDCSKPSINGTKLIPSCKSTHGLRNGDIEIPINLYCQPNGKWSGELYKCVPSNIVFYIFLFLFFIYNFCKLKVRIF